MLSEIDAEPRRLSHSMCVRCISDSARSQVPPNSGFPPADYSLLKFTFIWRACNAEVTRVRTLESIVLPDLDMVVDRRNVLGFAGDRTRFVDRFLASGCTTQPDDTITIGVNVDTA